jgi:ABC-type glycerol-3-phosphate transport system substrate-binding protein
MQKTRLTRRYFLRGIVATGVAAMGTMVASCAPRVIKETVVVEKEVAKVVKETVVVEKAVAQVVKETVVVEKAAVGREKVRVHIAAWIRAILPVDRETAEYNAAHPETEFILEDAVGAEWRTKLTAQVRAGRPEWSGNLGDNTYELPRLVETDVVVPIEDFLAASSAPAAAAVQTEFLALPRSMCTYKGKLYGVTFRMDVMACAYNKKMTEAVGMSEFPQTWEGIEELAGKIRNEFKDENVWGMQLSRHLFHGAGAIFYTLEKSPWTPEGIFDVLNPNFIEALQLLKKWQTNELCPTPPWQDQGGANMELFRAGKAGLVVTPHIWSKWAAAVQGTDVISRPVTMPPTGGKTPAWGFPTLVYKNAPRQQETFDFLMYVMGPLNDRIIRECIVGLGMATYQRAYDEIVPNVAGQQWQADLFEFVQDATPVAQTTFFSLQNDIIMAKQEDFLLGKTPDAYAAMEEAVKEIETEVAKQRVTG